MKPDVPMQLRSMTKALTDTVLPALDHQPAAQSQAEVVAKSLRMLDEQFDHLRKFAVADIEAQVKLCHRLAGAVPELDPADREARCAAAQTAAADPLTAPSELEEHQRRLRESASRVIAAAFATRDPELAGRVLALTLSDAKDQTDRERAWVENAGFDVFSNPIESAAAAAHNAWSV